MRFRELWKRKHESGQWLEIEAEAMSNQSDFSALNASGIILSSMVNKQKEFSENGKAGIDANAGMSSKCRSCFTCEEFLFIYHCCVRSSIMVDPRTWLLNNFS